MLRFSAREHLLLHKGPSEYINNGSEEEEDCNADIINTQFAEGLTDTLYILWKEFIMTFKKKKHLRFTVMVFFKTKTNMKGMAYSVITYSVGPCWTCNL